MNLYHTFFNIVFSNNSALQNSSIKKGYCELCEEYYESLDEVSFSYLLLNNTVY